MTINELKNKLNSLPKGSDAYDSAYDEAMGRIESQKPGFVKWAKKLISWIMTAKWLLTIVEIQEGLAIEIRKPKLEDDNMPDIDDVVSKCAGLVTVDERSQIVRLVHYTTQQYFQRTREKWFPSARTDIARACVTYLAYDAFNVGCCLTEDELWRRLVSNKLYHYAAHNLGYHLRLAARGENSIESEPLVMKLFENDSKVSAFGEAIMRTIGFNSDPNRMVGLHMAAYLGLRNTVTVLLVSGHDPNAQTTFKYTPLSFAAGNRHEVIVKLLLEKGANVNCQDKYWRLSWRLLSHEVTTESRRAISKLLLDKGANLERDYGYLLDD